MFTVGQGDPVPKPEALKETNCLCYQAAEFLNTEVC